ncbi:MAG: hypothetical protein ACXAC2_03680 [Candidatus Kariarchaeaceae archaeon]
MKIINWIISNENINTSNIHSGNLESACESAITWMHDKMIEQCEITAMDGSGDHYVQSIEDVKIVYNAETDFITPEEFFNKIGV